MNDIKRIRVKFLLNDSKRAAELLAASMSLLGPAGRDAALAAKLQKAKSAVDEVCLYLATRTET